MKLMVVHSLAVHGTASLKAFLSILGTRVLPVPSLYLTGLTNLPQVLKVGTHFAAMLEGSLELARLRGQSVTLYVGYLGSPDQADVILGQMEAYQDVIEGLIVDPVSGDHGRTYVPKAVVEAWPKLLAKAQWAFPNFTELTLLGGLAPTSSAYSYQDHLQAFSQKYPSLNFIATSLPLGSTLGLALYHAGENVVHEHPKLSQNFGGSGDIFAAYFLNYYLYQGWNAPQAMQQAATHAVEIIERAMAMDSPDLPLVSQGDERGKSPKWGS
ncbi:MAG: hypothetical protein AAF804_11185 [Bacteroidota bacterium]